MRFAVLRLALFASKALADGASILAAMATITNSTIALNATVAGFPAGIQGLADIIPLLSDSAILLNDINNAVDIAEASANLTTLEAIGVASATIKLSNTVNSTLTTVIAAKGKFDKLLIVSPVILLNLKLEKDSTDKFGAAVLSKVPASLQKTATALLAPIDVSFDLAIAAYD
ncbi:antigenic cell wall galactomannoprotein-like protein [Halenospora varia]|nr:antigenic cell wall galactomannoprotein-like protein [Halenospora varia]